MSESIRRIGVVVPAHDEEMVVTRCLEALGHAARAVSLPVTILVVLDDCGDRTEQICRSFPVDVRAVNARAVGVARHVGVASLLSGAMDPATIWISNTDADSVVPVTWLRDQLDLASCGADVVVGTVGLSDEDSHLGRNFKARYSLDVSHGDRHAHVHGANFSVSRQRLSERWRLPSFGCPRGPVSPSTAGGLWCHRRAFHSDPRRDQCSTRRTVRRGFRHRPAPAQYRQLTSIEGWRQSNKTDAGQRSRRVALTAPNRLNVRQS